MTARKPSVRGRQLQQNLATLRSKHPSAALRVERALGDGVAAIDRASPIEWLPFEFAVRFFDESELHLGAVEFRKFTSLSMQEALQGPLLHALWSSSLRLFGLDAHAVLRWSPQVWTLVYRDIAEVQWDSVEQTLRLDGLCESAARSRAFLDSLAGAIDGACALCSLTIHTQVERRSPTSAALVLPRV